MKRYVMLENNEIVDTSKYIEDEDWGTCAFEVKGKYLQYYLMPNHTLIQKLGIIKHQSDNLLDLLEDKDLIELGNEGNVIQYDIVYDEIATYKNIVAIWKRQGDIMRRYEI